MIKKIVELFKKLNELRRWTMYIYYNGVLIKKMKIRKETLQELKNMQYVINVFNKRQLFRSFLVNIIVRPVVLLIVNATQRKVYVGVVLEEGQNL